MLNKIIAFSIKNKLIVGLFILGLVGYGIYQTTQLSIDAVPDITNNQVQVITVTPSLGAPDVERLITFPIEQANSNIVGLKEMRSFSRFGLSLITLIFEDDVDIYWARQQVNERLKTAQEQIPQGIGSPDLGPITTGLGEIYQYTVKAKHGFENKYTITELRTIQDWIVRRQLLSVKGIADVSSFGGKLKQYEVAVSPAKLLAHNLTVNDIFNALESNNENTGGAYIEKKSTVLYIRSEGLIGDIEDINNIVIKSTLDGTPLLISDVAEVQIGHAIRYGAMTYNDEGEAAGGIVMMLKGGNSNEVINNVKERIATIQKTLPEGVEIEPFLDRSKMVNNAIHTVSRNLIEGALIVIFVLVLFLGNLRAGLIVASVIPLSMLFAIILMNYFGVSGNLMSLGALDFGLIVDGAVIIVEAVMFGIAHQKNTSLNQEKMDAEVTSSASRMMNSAVFGQIIILIVYLPIFTLQGIEGKMFKPMAQTIAFALLGAFVLSLTYIPMMSALFLKKAHSKTSFSDKMMDKITFFHQKWLKYVLKTPKMILGASFGLLLIALFVFSKMGGEFIPTLEEGDFALEMRVLPGSNIKTTSEVCLKAAHILKTNFPEVEKVVGKIGSGEIPTDPMPMEAADLIIILKDKSKWTSASTFDELAEKMSKKLDAIPGLSFSFQYPVAMRFNELMSGAKQDVVCKVYGENLDTLSRYASLLGKLTRKVEGTKEIYVESITGLPQIVIKYNRGLIAQYGLAISDINRIINTAFAGQSSGLVFEDEKRFDLVVRLAGMERNSIEDVQNLLIPTSKGTQIPLCQLADVSIKESVNQIQRDDAKRRIIVGFNIEDRDVQSVVNELKNKVNKQIKLPAGYYITYGGSFQNLIEAKNRLTIAVPISLLMIFILLYFAFNSIKQSLLIYSAIPLSIIGGVIFLALRGMPFSISAGIGFIALFGVAVLNGIVLIAEFNRIKKDGETDATKIVLEGTKLRLKPVLMTALVASLGFLPMALSHSSGAEVQRPLATVVIGGLLVATFMTLFVLPILYVLFEKGFKLPLKTKSLVVIGMIFSLNQVNAQTISLPAAIDSALANNLSVKNEKLKQLYQEKLKASAVNISQTSVNVQYGQYNSIYNDNSFAISQSFDFPTVYVQQKALKVENYTQSALMTTLKEAELRKQVQQQFYLLVYLSQKETILQQADSLYGLFLEKVKLRYQNGETNILEKTTAATQRGQIMLQLKHLKESIAVAEIGFQLLLNTEIAYVPASETSKMTFLLELDTTNIRSHPTVKVLEHEIQLSAVNTKLEKSRLLPQLNVGYNNQSLKGYGNDDNYYPLRTRFQYVQLGVGLPLFFGAQKSRINSSKTQELIAQNEYDIGYQQLKASLEQKYLAYQSQLETVDYFENSALPNADIIEKTANAQFEKGEINYLNWVTLMNSAISIRSNYEDAVNTLNQISIELDYLTTK